MRVYIAILLFILPIAAYAVDAPDCFGNWTIYKPLEDTGDIKKSDKIPWRAGDFHRFQTIPEYYGKLDFIRENYYSINSPSPIKSACEKFGPPYYVKEFDLPGYIEAKIKKYKCNKGCKKGVSAITVPYARDIPSLDSNIDGFKVDCQIAFFVNVYCEAPVEKFNYIE